MTSTSLRASFLATAATVLVSLISVAPASAQVGTHFSPKECWVSYGGTYQCKRSDVPEGAPTWCIVDPVTGSGGCNTKGGGLTSSEADCSFGTTIYCVLARSEGGGSTGGGGAGGGAREY